MNKRPSYSTQTNGYKLAIIRDAVGTDELIKIHLMIQRNKK